jgi:hypothetical protein
VRVQENGVGSMDVSDAARITARPAVDAPHEQISGVLDHQILQVFSFQPCRWPTENHTVEVLSLLVRADA